KNVDKVINDCKIELKDCQLKAIKHISENKCLGVVYDTGMGKTLIALIASMIYLTKNPDNRVLVVSPKSTLDNFKKEAKAYFEEKVDFSKYTFVTFRSMNGLENSTDSKKTFLIVDEVHNVKNMNTKSYKSLFSVSEDVDKIMIM